MAKQRVQVAPLQAPTAVKPTAAPVETYVRPAEEKANNGLSEFVSAITPALKAKADLDAQYRQQLAREVQTGIAEQQAFQAKIAVTDLLSEAVNQYETNKTYYLDAGPEVMAADRQAYFTDYLTTLEDAGTNPAIMQAIRQDLELGTVKFFSDPEAGYNQAKTKHDLSKRDAIVLDSITKITSDTNKSRQQQSVLINGLVADYFKTGRDKKGFNDKLMDLADKQSGILGETGLTDWLQSPESLNRFGVAEYADKVTRIKKNALSLAKAQAKAGEDAWFQSQLSSRIAGYKQTRDKTFLGIDTTVKHPTTGKEFKITVDDVQKAYEAESNAELQQRLADAADIPHANPDVIQRIHWEEAFTEFYNPAQLIPTQYANAMQSGASVLTAPANPRVGNTEQDIALARQAYQAYKTVETYSDGSVKRSGTLKSGDDLLRMRALDILVGPLGRDFDQALLAVQGQFFKDKASTVTFEKVQDNTEGWAFWNKSKFKDITNPQEVKQQFKDMVKTLVAVEGMDIEAAMEMAGPYLNEDWMIVESTNGVKTAIPLLNTDIKQYSGQEQAAADYLTESMLLPEVNNFARSIRGEGSGLSLRINPFNKNAVDVVVLDESGSQPPFTIDTVPFSELGTLSQGMMKERLRLKANEASAIERNAEIYTTINLAELPNLSDKDIETRVGITAEQATALREVREGINKMIGISAEDEAIASENKAILELQDMAKREAMEADESLVAKPVTVEAAMQQAAEQGMAVAAQDVTSGTSDIMDQINQARTQAIQDAASQGVEPAQAESMFDSFISSISNFFSTPEAAATEAPAPQKATPSESAVTPSEIRGSDKTGSIKQMTGTTVTEKASNLIISQEGYSSTPYPDGKDRSVGYGFYIPALEPDERALIKDIDNVTEDEAKAVMALKVQKLEKFWTNEVPDFSSLAEETQLGVVSMAYQLGAPNVTSDWPSFMKAIKEAAAAPEGSAERQAALDEAAFNMLYNRKADGSKTKTRWHTQTPKRAKAMAAAVQGQ